MCSEVLSGLCSRAQADGSLIGIQVARGCPQVNHLLFADDTMFFIRASKDCCTALSLILRKYEEASGQRINPEKSSITFSWKTPLVLKTMVKSMLQIDKEGGVGKYLGIPEHFGRKKKDLFTSIVDKIQKKTRGLSTKMLSMAGNPVMLRSVLSAMPSHAMTCFKLPLSVCKQIQSALTRFWWDDREGNKKMAWVSWSEMALPKEQGGLGFRDFQCFNDAFLEKLSWRILHNPESLVGRVLLGKYCRDEDFLTCGDRSSMSHGWRGILIGRDLLVRNLGWALGDGKNYNDMVPSLAKPNRTAKTNGTTNRSDC